MKMPLFKIDINKFCVLVILMIGFFGQAQVRTAFSPRFNESVKGDVTIIANNMLSRDATANYNGEDGNHDFTNNVYVDIDQDATTFNSSSADFNNPNPNLECISLYKVYLYWAAADLEKSDGTDNEPNWDFDDIKIMYPGETQYTTIKADEVIYRGRDTHTSNDPYVCYKDITDSVVALSDFYGTYQVANVEAKTGSLSEHGGGNAGTAGGWQVVFVYLSPELPSKNIGLFDGYAHVTRNVNNFDIDFNGFQTIPTGNVNANVVIGSLEGDRDLSGDKLQILDASNNFVDISTSQRAADNFFNSKITINETNYLDRNPASTNTLGFDASVFRLNNAGNSIIGNNQTSATIRLTSDQETYGLFLIGLAVDVWEPNLSPLSLGILNGTNPANPNDIIEYNLEVLNTGNDNAINLEFTATLPEQVSFESADDLPNGVTYNYNDSTRLLTFMVADGVANVGSSQTDINFKIKINDECYFLEDDCTLSYGIQFKATFNGVENPNDQITFSSEDFNICSPSPLVVNIVQPIVNWETEATALNRNIECDDDAALNEAQLLFPVPDKCDFEIIKSIGNFVPDASCATTGSYTNSWVFTDACGVTIDAFIQIINIVDTTAPTAAELGDIKVNCKSEVPEPDINLVTDFDDNCSTPIIEYISDVSDNNTCPETILRTYRVTDGCGNFLEVLQKIIIDDDIAPTGSNPATTQVTTVNDVPEPDPEVVIDEADNCGIPLVAFVSESQTSGGNCSDSITRIYSITDDCGNSINVQHRIDIGNSGSGEPLNVENPENTKVQCPGDVPEPDTSIISADGNAVEFISESSDGQSCPETISRIYRVTGSCGETIDAVHKIIIDDDILPTASNPLSIIVDDPSQVPEPNISVVRDPADNCGPPTVAFIEETDDPVACTNYKTRIYSVTDTCGNSIKVYQLIIIGIEITVDIAGPEDLLLDCKDEIPQPDISLITASDSENNDLKIEFVSDTSAQEGCEEIISRIYKAYNECGAYAEYVQLLVISDTTPPVLNTDYQKEISIMCEEPPAKPEMEFIDDCSANITVEFYEEVRNLDENNSDVARKWTATDDCGNTTVAEQVIHIQNNSTSSQEIISLCIGDDPVNINMFTNDLQGTWHGEYMDLLEDGSTFDSSFVPEGSYVFTYRSSSKVCVSNLELTIDVVNCIETPCIKSVVDVDISKMVTPNSDGYNDVFKVAYLLNDQSTSSCDIKIKVQIFNRWGTKVYENLAYDNEWNGNSPNSSMSSSDKLPAGAYYYIVELENSGLNPIQGYIHLGVAK